MDRRRITEKAYEKAGDLLPGTLTGLPGITDRDFWEGLPEEVSGYLTDQGKKTLEQPVPQLLFSDYREFSLNGNRIRFEDQYFARRKMLTRLVLAECVSDDCSFLPKILDLVIAILEESTWCLPAHNTYVRDQKPLPFPDVKRPVIDLFAAETGAILALTEFLLRDRLEKDYALLGERIDDELKGRILKPYLNFHFWWMGDGLQPMCNWTPWITQNVLLALFSRRKDVISKEDLRKVFEQAVRSVDFYLDDYGDDGCCNEGAFYYGHSGLALFGCYDVMNRITEGKMEELWKDPLIRNIASYIVKMQIGEGQYFNYSDASPYAGNRTAKDHLFARYTGNPGYEAMTSLDFRAQSLRDRLLPEEENLYDHLLQLTDYEKLLEDPAPEELPEDAWFESTGLLIARDPHWALAVKAGDNGDSHNHNDIGSLTLYLDKKPFLIDLGVETYTAKTFSDQRYEIWTMQSQYHNTLNFGRGTEPGIRIMQKDGKEAAAGNVRYKIDTDGAEISMDLAGAYKDPGIKKALRSVCFMKGTSEKAGRILIRDHAETEGDLRGILSFMTYERPEEIRDGEKIRIRVGSLGVMEITGAGSAVIERIPIEDERLKKAWKHEVYRILLTMAGKEAEVMIKGE